MTDKKRSTMQFTLADVPVLSMYMSPTVTGFTMGIRSLKRNVKLTYCLNLDDEFDCHVKDEGIIVWQKTCPKDKMMTRLEKAFNKSMFRWKPRQKIFVPDSRLMDRWQFDVVPGNAINIDFEGLLLDSAKMVDVILRRSVRLEDMVKDEIVTGFQKRLFGMWIVFAAPDGTGIRFPLRTDKGLFNELYVFQGLEFYFNYLEEQGLLDNLGFDPDSIEVKQIIQNLEISLIGADKKCEEYYALW